MASCNVILIISEVDYVYNNACNYTGSEAYSNSNMKHVYTF